MASTNNRSPDGSGTGRRSHDAPRRISKSEASVSSPTGFGGWHSPHGDTDRSPSMMHSPDGHLPLSSWSTSSDKQLGHGSPGPQDRVFPIRSVVSVDPTQTPYIAPGPTYGDHEGFPGLMIPGSTPIDITMAAPSRAAKLQAMPDGVVPAPASKPPLTSSDSSTTVTPATHSATGPSAGPSTTPDQAKPSNVRREQRSSRAAPTAAQLLYGPGNRLFSDGNSERSGDSISMVGTNSTAGTMSTHGRPSSGKSVGGESQDSQTPTGADDTPIGLYTARFKHVITSEGHAIITGRDGETLQRCEDEPIHIPGAIQGFGMLIALREEADGTLGVRIVSENSHRFIGYTPAELFKLKSFTDILSEEQTDNLLDHIDFIRDEDAESPAVNGPEVFIISIKNKKRKSVKLWCAMHIHPANSEIIICEFEFDDDQLYPLMPPEEMSGGPVDTLHSLPTEAERSTSTAQNRSRPLRILRSARRRKGEAAAMEVFNIMSQVQEQLASAPNLEAFLNTLVGVVKELTGFHRVMIYQFDSSFNGRVVTELVDPKTSSDLYYGLNFPASDIPKQARELYKINKVRLLYDRELKTARLVCRTPEELETPLDLTHSYLRAMSPIHVKYLGNMGVRSSMSISINAFGDLWGLISCHGYGPKGMRVSFPIRKMCRVVGDTASRNIERLSYASRLQARKLINTVPSEANPSGYIIASSDDLLKLFDADFGLLSIQGETKILGNVEDTQEALAMLEYLRMRNLTSVVTSQDIKEDFPDLRYGPGFRVIAGLLLVPLSAGGNDFIVFFRKGQTKEVKWAGNPYEKFVKEGTEGYLEPRQSFQAWSETVVGKCREWTEEEVETAAVLCLVYGKFIEVWRQKEAALQSSQLTRLLLANSAHEVRTPLNAIINYLEIALEGTLDHETRENLAKSHSASKSLIYVINDLLDLTKTEEGQELVIDEVFDLPATVRDASEIFVGDAGRKGIQYDVTVNPGIPQFVHGDQRKVRQAVANIIANAMQNTTSGTVTVELWLAERNGSQVAVDIVVEDTGVGMSNQTLDALFRDLEQVSTADGDGLFGAPGRQKQLTDKKDGRVLGLGLAIVARIVRNMDGQLRLKSEEGIGSRFVVQLPFLVMDESAEEVGEEPATSLSHSSIHQVSTPPPVMDGEVMLVDKASSTKIDAISRTKSGEDNLSLQSFRSGSSKASKGSAASRKSDVDRLIDAMCEPLAIGRAEAEDTRLQRTNSRGSGTSKKSGNSITGSMGHNAVSSRPRSQRDRPTTPSRQRSHGTAVVPEHLRSPTEGPPGTEYVQDSKTLLRAVRMPDEFRENPAEHHQDHPHTASRVLFDLPKKPAKLVEAKKPTAESLHVLVAEDDPINSRIIMKRLEKVGHQVYHTVNGEDCASAYCEKSALYDVILMDMQMPIVDGLTSTKMIRSFEKTHPADPTLSEAGGTRRIPILAVSASLVERERYTYIDAGFDGWILKPIDFNRLNTLLTGVVDEETRSKCHYQPGQWERGGFFDQAQRNVSPIGKIPASRRNGTRTSALVDGEQPEKGSITSESSGSSGSTQGTGGTTPVNEPRRPLIHDERLDSSQSDRRESVTPPGKGRVEGVTGHPDA